MINKRGTIQACTGAHMDNNEPQHLNNWIAYDVSIELMARVLRTRSFSGAKGMLRSLITALAGREWEYKTSSSFDQDNPKQGKSFTIWQILAELEEEMT